MRLPHLMLALAVLLCLAALQLQAGLQTYEALETTALAKFGPSEKRYVW